MGPMGPIGPIPLNPTAPKGIPLFSGEVSGKVYSIMSTKEIVAGLLERLPENVSLHEVAREIEFIAGVREGFESYEREGGSTIAEVRASVSSWAKAGSK